MDTRPFIDAVRELNAGFVKLLESMSALRALSSIRIYGQDEKLLLDSALQVLVQNQDLERCSVFIRDGEQLMNMAGLDWEDLIRHPTDNTARRRRPTVFKLGVGIVGLAARTGELQHSAECQNDSRFLQAVSGSEASEPPQNRLPPVGSLISVPIRSGQEVLGVLNVSHPHCNFFNESHERTLQVFSNFLGQMLVNNRLVHRMDRQVRERTRQLEQALSEAHELKRRYEQLAIVDELTALHNRRFFFAEARSAVARLLRDKAPFSVLLIDIDHFKQINDSYGHAVGDEVLRQVAARLQSKVREGDILARFGGEEFVVALPDTDTDGALRLAERIRQNVRDTVWQVDGRDIRATLSIGVAGDREFEDTDTQTLLDRLLSEADQALYFGKYNGRDQSHAYGEPAAQSGEDNSTKGV